MCTFFRSALLALNNAFIVTFVARINKLLPAVYLTIYSLYTYVDVTLKSLKLSATYGFALITFNLMRMRWIGSFQTKRTM
jgi:hypothetical protein